MYPLKFARLYDELTDDYDYGAWAEHYISLARLVGAEDIGTVCECGCGTGSMSVRLARMGYSVTGIDISGGMLEVASRKAREEGLEIRFVERDMRFLELTKPVDAIFCPCDGVNYLLGDGDPSAFFKAAFKWLKPAGALVFDVSTPEKLGGMDGQLYFEDREDVSYFWRNSLAGDLMTMNLTFFCRKPGGLYERFDERQVQRAHEMGNLISSLNKAGFAQPRAFGEMRLNAPARGDMRWHFAAKKL